MNLRTFKLILYEFEKFENKSNNNYVKFEKIYVGLILLDF